MIYISPAVLLAEDYTSLVWPMFLWNNVVTITGITADHELAAYPATNLWNPQTSSIWKSGTIGDQTVEFETNSDQTIDAVGIARHNFGSSSIVVQIQGITAEPGAVWETLAEMVPGDDSPLLLVFTGGYYTDIRINLAEGSAAPQAGVVYIGKTLRMVTGIPPGHVPLKDAYETESLVGFAENGDFLDDIITAQRLSTSVQFRLLPGDWYREHMRGFVQSRDPFFFGWCPALYPHEMGYAKHTGSNAKPSINQSEGQMDITLPIIGLAL